MKVKRKIFLSIISVCVLISLAILFLFPLKNLDYSSFVFGVIVCLMSVSLILFLFSFAKRKPSNNHPADSKPPFFVYISLFVFTMLIGIIGSTIIFQQKELKEIQSLTEEKRALQNSALVKSVKQGNLITLMANVLSKVESELSESSNGTLSDETIDQIAALSYAFEPYKYIEGDSLAEQELSPERGQLLLALLKTNIDSSSFKKILRKTSFRGVDLKGAALRGADLSGADLRGANFSEADLRGVDFSDANLWGANLWSANLKNARLQRCILKRANLAWADGVDSDFNGAFLNGINLTGAKLNRADMRVDGLRWANLNGAILKEANLEGSDLYGTILTKANLSKADLSNANLLFSNLSHSILNEANLSGVILTVAGVEDGDWLNKINDWKVIGAKEIQENYKIALDKSKRTKFRLEKIK